MLILDDTRPFYRANFHMHTTKSDGAVDPMEALRRYRTAGYDILAVTDHRRVTETAHVAGLLTIPGIELDFFLPPGQAIHLLGLGVSPEIVRQWNPKGTAEDAVRAIHTCGGQAVLAHPAWSMNTTEKMRSLAEAGVDAVEIWNSVSNPPLNARRADSSAMLDALWANHPASLMPVLGNDDTHTYGAEFASGWTMVQPDALTVPAVLDAVRQGRCYATQGPEIRRLAYEQGRLTVDCSPAESIIFYSNCPWVGGRTRLGHGMTGASYEVQRDDHFVRVQVTDARGRSAWSGPIAVHA